MATSGQQKNGPPEIQVRDFSGMEPNCDPHDIAPGKSVNQVNCGPGPRGELRVRLGIARVVFDVDA